MCITWVLKICLQSVMKSLHPTLTYYSEAFESPGNTTATQNVSLTLIPLFFRMSVLLHLYLFTIELWYYSEWIWKLFSPPNEVKWTQKSFRQSPFKLCSFCSVRIPCSFNIRNSAYHGMVLFYYTMLSDPK